MKLSWSYQSNCVYTCISYFSLYVNISVTVEPIIMIIIIITIIIIKKKKIKKKKQVNNNNTNKNITNKDLISRIVITNKNVMFRVTNTTTLKIHSGLRVPGDL